MKTKAKKAASAERRYRPEQVSIMEELRRQVSESDYMYFVDYRGMSVAQLADLRARLRDAAGRCRVFKNTFLRKVAEEKGWGDALSGVTGPLALLTGKDAVASAKILAAFIKENTGLPKVKGGVLSGRALSAADVDALAQIPPREVLLAMFVGTLAAPMSRLVGALNQKLASIVYVLKALEEKKK